MKKKDVLWIAVALATAIRLFAHGDRGALAIAGILAAVGAIAMIFARDGALRVAGLFLILAGTADAAARFAETGTLRSFTTRSAQHLAHDVAHIRNQIAATEASLDADAAAVAPRIANVRPVQRIALFTELRKAIGSKPGRGARIVDQNGTPIAWWGEELRTAGGRSYEFDATNVYVIRARKAGGYSLQMFERIPNEPRDTASTVHHADAWVDSVKFHGGFLRLDGDSKRFMVEKRPDSTLYIDVDPRSLNEVVESGRQQARTVTALLLAIGALIVLAMLWRDLSRPAVRVSTTIALIAVARIALLAIHPPADPLHIFRFDVYASKILGPFSRSPFDLFLTALAITAIVIVLARFFARVPIIIRAAFALAAAWGLVELQQNLVNNSRISSIPDHIVPNSTAQFFLLGSAMLLGLSVLILARHDEPRRRGLTAAAAYLLPVLLAAYTFWPTAGAALLCAG